MKEASSTAVATPAKNNTPFFAKESGGDFFSGTDFFGDVQCCACEEQVQEKPALPQKDEEEVLPEIQQVAEEHVPEPAPVEAPAPVAAPVEAVGEEENAGEEELQLKAIFESDIPPGDDIQRSCRECEEADVVYRSPTPGIQLLDDVKSDGSRESVIAAAKTMLGKIAAKTNDGTGKRVGVLYLLEIFHLAAPGVWDDRTIENIGGQLPSWCGIFAVWAHKKAGKNVGDWQMGKGVSAFHTLTQTTSPQPGDIGYIDQPFQHHCIVVRVEGDTVYSIDGNSGLHSEVKENAKPFNNYSGFYTAFAGGGVVQPKLTVGEPDDVYEQEADSVADQVIQRMAIATPVQGSVAPVKVQRKPIFESNSPEYLQRKCAACEQEEKMLQKKGGGSAGSSAPAAVETQLQSSKGSGSPLPAHVSEQMGDAMGADFSNVRIHTDSSAVEMNKELHAQAFTHGNHIYFNSGKYNTAQSSGQHLLAHELTHTIQQGAAGKVSKKENTEEIVNKKPTTDPVNKQDIHAPTLNLLSVEEQTTYADEIYDWLSGWTSSADSAKILAKFGGLNQTDVTNILNKLAIKSEENITYVYRWLRSDLVTSDWKKLLLLFVQVQAPQISQLVATEVLGLLSGYTSDSNSTEICDWLTGPNGTGLDNILSAMEQQSKYGKDAMSEYLFGDLQNFDAYKLAETFLKSGGGQALLYVVHWYAYKVKNLLAGWTSISDSDKILKNFQRLPNPIIQAYVYTELDDLCQKEWQQSAAHVLMDDMQMSDYNALREEVTLLPEYSIERNFWRRGWEFITNAVDYRLMFLEYAVCGIAGIIMGIIDAIASIVTGIVDLGFGVLHLIGWLISVASGGAVCRESEEKVHEFLDAIGKAVKAPGETISDMWEESKLQASLIEGPFQDCGQAIFWVRRVTNMVVNVALLLFAGYGAAKAALEALEGVKTLADFGRLVAKLPIALLRKMKDLPANLTKAVKDLVTFIRNLDKFISNIKTAIGIIRVAAADENFYISLRKMGKQFALEKLETEKLYWKERRQKWLGEANVQEGKIAGVEAATDEAAVVADTNIAGAETQVAKAEAEAKAVKSATDTTTAEMKEGKPASEKPHPVAGDVTTPHGLKWEQSLNEETQAMLRANPEIRKMWHNMDPEVRRLLTYCASPCIPEGISPDNLSKVEALKTRLKLGAEDKTLREYLHMFRKDQHEMAEALKELESIKTKAQLDKFLDDKIIMEIEKLRPGWKVKKMENGLWQITTDQQLTVTENELGSYKFLRDERGTGNFFEGHHGIQNAWAEYKFGAYYSKEEAPAILLRSRNFEEGSRGTPHGLINDEQRVRKIDNKWKDRTFSDELEYMEKDMEMVHVPADIKAKNLENVLNYYSKLYKTMEGQLSPEKMESIFGGWKPKK